ncbi:MAG: rRNA pseudouridine synthase [Candidatus Nomurabacteria bacterium]|jgi:pseudouridine synthase|nr:rRNA pseudouridine synthase [Candidatus Nomurabacteria bacterium]
MRLNKFIASATGKSRREADDLIASGHIKVDGKLAIIGSQVDDTYKVTLDGRQLALPTEHTLVILHKPIGYVSSRRAQAKDSETLYELLPPKLQKLKTVGRLDRDSSGLILLTDDGDFAFSMTHPKFAKVKVYEVELDRPLEPLHQQMISDFGINLPDGKSRLTLERLESSTSSWRVTMSEGRNRQIRRTFAALGYTVTKLHRTNFGNYCLDNLPAGQWIVVKKHP